jgi:hypothetical protein
VWFVFDGDTTTVTASEAGALIITGVNVPVNVPVEFPEISFVPTADAVTVTEEAAELAARVIGML